MTRARTLAWLWVVGMLVALGWPAEDLPQPDVFGIDKAVHVVLFAVGTVIALRGWPASRMAVLVLLALFAGLTELWQALLPTGRYASIFDVAANLVGIAVGWGIWKQWMRAPAGSTPTRPGT